MASSQIPAVITYHKPGTQPPLYVAGTFSDPPWQPYEMEHAVREDGEYYFTKEVRGEPGSKIQYKFCIGDGDRWVLHDDRPIMTDSDGNTNHVLEVTPQKEADRSGLLYAHVAAKHLQPSSESAATDRSSAGTPISARVAAEVADSAALLHEEVPDRERPSPQQKPVRNQSTIVILEPPLGEGSPFRVQPRAEELADDQEDYIADKSPLFSHECAGLYESDEEEDQAESDDLSPRAAPVRDVEEDQIDLNDPTLERFPSSREDIMDAVRKLETGLQVDQASFDGNPRSPVVNPSRRGTEDITGDFLLGPPQAASSPPAQRTSKKSPQGSVGSIPPASLHAISEDEELAEEQVNFPPAVVFSNPLKRRPQNLQLLSTDEDEGIALPEGVSPRTVKPPRRPSTQAEGSPPHSPLSPKTTRTALPTEDPSYADVASREPTAPAAAEPSAAATSGPAAQPQPNTDQPPTLDQHPSVARRLSYAEVAASKPTPTTTTPSTETPTPAHDSSTAATTNKPSEPSTSSTTQEGGGSGGSQLRKRQQPGPSEPESTSSAASRSGSGVNNAPVPAVQPKGGGAGWIRAILRRVFVDMLGGVVRRVLRAFGLAGRRGGGARGE